LEIAKSTPHFFTPRREHFFLRLAKDENASFGRGVNFCVLPKSERNVLGVFVDAFYFLF
jgi:hypothetical protein